jgi:predicted nucleic acid-binding protein
LLRLIDTSVVIALGEQQRTVMARFATLQSLPVLSVLTLVELEGGLALRSGEEALQRRRLLREIKETTQILEFGEVEAVRYGEIVQTVGFSRPRIIDRMIAAQAIVAGASLATLNPRDFRDISGLSVEDWSA